MRHITHIRQITWRWLLALTIVSSPAMGHAASMSLSDAPLFISTAVMPNVMFTLDDSGSMQGEILPEPVQPYFVFPRPTTLYGATWGWPADATAMFALSNKYARYYRTAKFNPMYYDPAKTYTPWTKADGTLMPAALPGGAYHNPYNTGEGTRILDAENTQTANWMKHDGTSPSASLTFWPASYFTTTISALTGPTDTNNIESGFSLVEIKSTTTFAAKAAGRADCAGATCTYAEEMQNFANWYTYYRSRILAARAGIGKAFSTYDNNMRVGFGAINKGSTSIDNVNTSTVISGVRMFTGTDRTAFFNNLYGHTMPSSGTPLRRAMDDVGRYFSRIDDRGPWGQTPGSTGGTQYACRQNYHILTTDGYWNGAAASTAGAKLNVDNTAGSTHSKPVGSTSPTSYTYAPANPYSDSYANTLSDVAMYYWVNDLRTDLANIVPNNSKDPAFWQHMVNFTVGFGVTGSVSQANIDSAFTSTPAAITWPDPTGSDTNKSDDLAHAGINSRGGFFSASDPTAFSTALVDALSDITGRSGVSAAAAVATNSTSLNTGSQVYIAKFNSETWSGTLFAAPISNAGVIGAPTWNSDTLLANPTATDRVIITYKPSTGVGIPFRWPATLGSPSATELDGAQTTFLNSAAVLNYLRGDESNEGTGTSHFRSRPTTKLGDIVNSSPQYVGKPVGQYENENLFRQAYASASYETFRTAQASRTPMVYVGANDGMLHGFNASAGADKGKELLAYIPNQVYSNLKSLSDKTYTHKYFVDGSATIADAEISGWKTVLVGGLNKGGKGIYALNVTNPDAFTEGTAANISMWEFTDADLGYTFSKPMIVKINTNEWAAIFGNGYNNTVATADAASVSTTGHAVLYIVSLSDGSLIKKITTNQGSTATPNGLSSINGMDSDGNGTVDYVYGGDLLGNMWKFDISSTNKNHWKIPYGTTSAPEPLYSAKDSAGSAQAITTRPEVSFHPTNTDTFMVYFGTGKYLEATDKINTQTQTFYGIWDNAARVSTVTTRNSSVLLQQTFSVSSIGGKSYRIASNNAINWMSHKGWYQDLPTSLERNVGSPTLLKGILIYSTFTPGSDPCLSGGTGYLMAVNYKNGGLPPDPVFDTNGATAGFGTTLVAGVEVDVGSGGSNVIGRDGRNPVALSPAAACDPADTACTACVENDTRPQCLQKINPKSIPGLRISWRELTNK